MVPVSGCGAVARGAVRGRDGLLAGGARVWLDGWVAWSRVGRVGVRGASEMWASGSAREPHSPSHLTC